MIIKIEIERLTECKYSTERERSSLGVGQAREEPVACCLQVTSSKSAQLIADNTLADFTRKHPKTFIHSYGVKKMTLVSD